MTHFNENIVLGIETSCDETAVGIYQISNGLRAHKLHSQIKAHVPYGGVMPEVASRDHIKRISPLIKEALADANIKLADLNAVAYTTGPGLIGSLMVGACVARSLAYALKIPAIPVHHMEGHLLAPMLEDKKPNFPFLSLLISGGHTQLIDVTDIGAYTIIGESMDDAAGEAFDKTARLLGLAYPGGPLLAKLATKGVAGRYIFPRPMTKHRGLDFSFSGLKTFAMTTWQKSDQSEQTKADIALAFEQAIAETLMIKCKRALVQTGHKTLVVSGGVSANLHIRDTLQQMAQINGFSVYYPRFDFCTDNGAMIALTGAIHQSNAQSSLAIHTQSRISLSDFIQHIY